MTNAAGAPAPKTNAYSEMHPDNLATQKFISGVL